MTSVINLGCLVIFNDFESIESSVILWWWWDQLLWIHLEVAQYYFLLKQKDFVFFFGNSILNTSNQRHSHFLFLWEIWQNSFSHENDMVKHFIAVYICRENVIHLFQSHDKCVTNNMYLFVAALGRIPCQIQWNI